MSSSQNCEGNVLSLPMLPSPGSLPFYTPEGVWLLQPHLAPRGPDCLVLTIFLFHKVWAALKWWLLVTNWNCQGLHTDLFSSTYLPPPHNTTASYQATIISLLPLTLLPQQLDPLGSCIFYLYSTNSPNLIPMDVREKELSNYTQLECFRLSQAHQQDYCWKTWLSGIRLIKWLANTTVFLYKPEKHADGDKSVPRAYH